MFIDASGTVITNANVLEGVATGETITDDTIEIDSPLAKAVQPFTTALNSDYKQLSRRLFEHITRSREAFESAGFNFRAVETRSEESNDEERQIGTNSMRLGLGRTGV